MKLFVDSSVDPFKILLIITIEKESKLNEWIKLCLCCSLPDTYNIILFNYTSCSTPSTLFKCKSSVQNLIEKFGNIRFWDERVDWPTTGYSSIDEPIVGFSFAERLRQLDEKISARLTEQIQQLNHRLDQLDISMRNIQKTEALLDWNTTESGSILKVFARKMDWDSAQVNMNWRSAYLYFVYTYRMFVLRSTLNLSL